MPLFRCTHAACLSWLQGIFCCLLLGVLASPAGATDQVTFSWRANPEADMVLGYRLYYGETSRFDDLGVTRENFSYTWSLDFSASRRCLLTGDQPVCEPFSDTDVLCTGMEGETPSCTLFGLEGQLYFAMTAYNELAESDYTPELKAEFSPPAVAEEPLSEEGAPEEDPPPAAENPDELPAEEGDPPPDSEADGEVPADDGGDGAVVESSENTITPSDDSPSAVTEQDTTAEPARIPAVLQQVYLLLRVR